MRAKSVKRKGEFATLANERTARLAARAKEIHEKQKAQKTENAMEEDNKPEEEAKPEAVDYKKVKTSGLKNTSRIRKRGLKKRGHTKF